MELNKPKDKPVRLSHTGIMQLEMYVHGTAFEPGKPIVLFYLVANLPAHSLECFLFLFGEWHVGGKLDPLP